MKLTLLLISTLLTSCSSTNFTTYQDGDYYYSGFRDYEPRKRVVVIDSGLEPQYLVDNYMCRDISQISLEEDKRVKNTHGTSIISIIKEDMNTDDYCITSVRMKVSERGDITETKDLVIRALDLSNVYAVNMSYIISEYNHLEYQAIRYSVYSGVRFSVAAGNEKVDLDKACLFYPACYGKLLDKESLKYRRAHFKVIGAKAGYTNYGSVVDIYLNGGYMGTPSMRGTSSATAQYTNMLVRKQLDN